MPSTSTKQVNEDINDGVLIDVDANDLFYEDSMENVMNDNNYLLQESSQTNSSDESDVENFTEEAAAEVSENVTQDNIDDQSILPLQIGESSQCTHISQETREFMEKSRMERAERE